MIRTIAEHVRASRRDLQQHPITLDEYLPPDPGPGPHCVCPPDATLPEHMAHCPVRLAFEAEQCNCPEKYEARHRGPLHHLGTCPIRLKEGPHMAIPATDLRDPVERLKSGRVDDRALRAAAGTEDAPPLVVQDEVAEAELGIGKLLDLIADDPARSGLEDTPARVVKAMREMTAGYDVDVEKLLTRQFDEIDCDGMVVLRGIQFVSLCEHHLLPFVGVATVAYIPQEGAPVVGLSKLARVVEAFAARLQVQERMTVQITGALDEHLQTRGSACVLSSTHSCMSMRGVKKPGAEMVTSSTTGIFREDERTRAEFMALASK